MLSVYLGSLIFGGILLGVSMLGQGDHGNAHADHGEAGDHHHGPGSVLLPFLSLRFWTFALAFFGLTGAVLTGLAGAGTVLTALISGGVGIGTGHGASRLIGALTGRPIGIIGAAGPVGREGKLLLAVDKHQRGKIRISIGGVSNDFVAETESPDPLPAGAPALVVAMRGNVALVERSPTALPAPERESS